jgi:hypothetical protein
MGGMCQKGDLFDIEEIELATKTTKVLDITWRDTVPISLCR